MAIAGNKATTARIDADAVTEAKIADDAVTYAKVQNVSATDRILGRDSASAGVIEEITPANLRTMINVEDGATADQSNAEIVAAVEAGSDSNTFTDADHTKLNGIASSANAYVHPNHSGEVTSTADGATVIADNIVDEANLKVSNAPSNGYMLTAQSGDTGGLTWAAAAGGGTATASYNGIINGDFTAWQRGIAFRAGANDDDTCTASRWRVLSDGNDIVDVVRAGGLLASGSRGGAPRYSLAFDVETEDKKFGIVQIIEATNCSSLGIVGTATVSLSFLAKASNVSKLDNVKAAVIGWSGSADAVTSDVVSAWNAEGTNPTLATSWTYENTPANLNVTTSDVRYTIENISVDTATTNNLAVFIWSDVTDTTAGHVLYITDVQLEPGATANDFKRDHIGTTMTNCQRYYVAETLTPLTAYGTTGVLFGMCAFPTEMKGTPTVTMQYNGTSNNIYTLHDAAQNTVTWAAILGTSARGMGHGYGHTPSGWADGVGYGHQTYITLDAEL